jgi:hypothetical protein
MKALPMQSTKILAARIRKADFALTYRSNRKWIEERDALDLGGFDRSTRGNLGEIRKLSLSETQSD